jgi:hypothetical protein
VKTKLSSINLEVPAKIVNASEALGSIEMAENDDIMFVGFTMCHEGSNSKGDRFTLDELRKSWRTIAHKPINWEHEEPNLGVVLDSALKITETKNGNASKSPAQIDCVGTIWSMHYPEHAALLSYGANDGTLKVSMEAYFTDVDYIIGDNEESIPSAEAEADITDYLGTYAEKYGNKFVSRALKNVIFGGVGITASPADKEAAIWACASNKSDEEYHIYLHDVFEGRKKSLMQPEQIVEEHEKVHWKLSKKFGKGEVV